MRTLRIPAVLLALLLVGFTAAPAQDEAAKKPQLKLSKKRAATYTITRETKSSFGDNVTTTTSEVTYKISRGDPTDSGDFSVNVEYVALKVKRDSERRPYEFDSSKEAVFGEIGAAVRKAILGPLSVILSGGAIKEIKGFPESDASDDDDREARTRRFMLASIAGERNLRRDMELVLASAVQGQTLEEGKSYRVKRTASNDGSGRRRFRGFRSDVVFKFEGAKKNRAKFSLWTAAPERQDDGGDRPQFERKETGGGQAIVSLANGMLASLSLDAKIVSSGEYQGREFSFTREVKVTVKRQRAARNAGQQKKKGNKGKERKRGNKKKGKKAEDSVRDA